MESHALPSLVYAWSTGESWFYATDAAEVPECAIAAQRVDFHGATVLFVGRQFKDGFVWGAKPARGTAE